MKPKVNYYLLLIVAMVGALCPAGSAIAVVDLLYFIATPGTTTIVLTWETATEFDNIGFYVLRGETAVGPFTPISPRIISLGDPLTGHLYSYEDVTVVIGVQYHYVLEILNADSTSDFTAPVAAIILAPTATPTITPTRTQTPLQTTSPTTTPTPTNLPGNMQSATAILPTNTTTLTQAPTATNTRAPTITLEPISISKMNFPIQTPSLSESGEIVALTITNTEVDELRSTTVVSTGAKVQSIVVVVILLWVALAIFLFFVIRQISRDEKQRL